MTRSGPRHFDAGERERVIRLYRLGKPVDEIAKRCGVSESYVSKTATEQGISRRRFKRRGVKG